MSNDYGVIVDELKRIFNIPNCDSEYLENIIKPIINDEKIKSYVFEELRKIKKEIDFEYEDETLKENMAVIATLYLGFLIGYQSRIFEEKSEKDIPDLPEILEIFNKEDVEEEDSW